MKIENLKDLQKVIALCRKTGVDVLKLDGLEISLGVLPRKNRKQTQNHEETAGFDPGPIAVPKVDKPDFESELTPEQLLFYSSRPEVPGLDNEQ